MTSIMSPFGISERKAHPQPGSGRWQGIECLVMETLEEKAARAVGVQRLFGNFYHSDTA